MSHEDGPRRKVQATPRRMSFLPGEEEPLDDLEEYDDPWSAPEAREDVPRSRKRSKEERSFDHLEDRTLERERDRRRDPPDELED